MKHFFTFSFLLFAFSLFAQPANDDCPGIFNLGAAPICDDNIIYNNFEATESNIGFDNFPSCWVGNPVRDVWFSFVAVDTILDYRITVTACPDATNNIDPILNPQIAIYRGDCEFDGLQLLECSSASNGDGIVEVDLFGLTPGITYFIRINDWSPSGTPNDGAFKLCIIKKPPISTVDQGGSTACSGTLTDSGGPDGDYGNSENFAYTICPSAPHNCINFSLEYYNVESFNSDQINFFDGPTTGSPIIGSISGGDNGGSLGGVCYAVSASSGCLTVQFVSNGSTVFEGFQGSWECTADACQPNQEITVQTGSSPADIVQSVVTGQTSITITNIDCANSALATFQAGSNTDLGLEKGILLTSGSANNVSNPGSFFSSAPTGTPGDDDLDYLSTINGNNSESNDACIVEMDVFASTDEITFEYIFGSEEYPEWVGTSFNDIFAFLVSGPGIVGDPNIGNQENVATLPDGTFIQINSVNDAQNWQFYRDNQDGQSVVYDGLTSDSLGVKKSLTARIPTIPCNTYHLKFAIADRGDTAFDSGVFISDIKGGSPNLGVNYNSGIQYLVEECVNIPDEVVISLNAPVTQPTTFDIVISGTATLGTDYLLTIPGSITFNSGTEVFSFPIQALSDGIPEGTETIIIQLVRDFGCGATILATLEIELQDNLDVQIFEDQLDTVLVCEGNGAQLNVIGAADYFWQPPGIFSDPNISNPIVTPATSQWVMVTGTLGICVDVDSVYLNLISPEVNIFPEGIINICETDSITLTATNNVNNSNLLWTTFFFPLTDPNNPVQTIVPPPFFNSIFLEVEVELGGCVATDQVTINVDAFDFPVVASDTTICQNYSVDLGTDVIGSSTNFVWTPNIGLSPGNNVSGPIATPDVTTTYTLIGSSASGVCKDTAEVTITVIPVDVEIQNPDTIFICLGESATLNNINSTAGVGVTWTPNFFLNQVTPEQVVVTPPVTTWYYATLNAATCTVTDSVLVYVDSLPNLSIMANPAKESYCLGEQVLLTSPTYEPGNFPGITLMWDSEIPGALTPDSFLNLVFIATETHTYVRTTTVNACTSIDSIEIIVVPSTLISIVPPFDTICPGEAVNLMVVGPPGLTDFSWEPSGGLSCSDCPNPIASPISTTQYNVTAEFMGCPVGASAGIFVPSGPVFDLQDTLICPGEQVLLNPINNPDATYSWTSSDGSITTTEPMPTVTPAQTTTYTVTATVGDCVSTGSVTVTVAEDFMVDIAGATFICYGDQMVLTANITPSLQNLNYTWLKAGDVMNNETSSSLVRSPTESNTYTVIVGDAMGCFSHVDSVQVEVTGAIVVDSVVALEYVVNDSTIYEGEEFVLVAYTTPSVLPGATYNWYVDNLLVSTTNDTISEVLNAIEIFGADVKGFENVPIRVEIITQEGCTKLDTNNMQVHNIPIGIPNAFSPNGDSKNDSFRVVSLIPLTIDEFKVWNRWGQLVYDNESGPDGWNGKQNNEDAPSDVYIYRVVYQITGGSGKQYTKKGDVTLLR